MVTKESGGGRSTCATLPRRPILVKRDTGSTLAGLPAKIEPLPPHPLRSPRFLAITLTEWQATLRLIATAVAKGLFVDAIPIAFF
jgi:hypothetical protein